MPEETQTTPIPEPASPVLPAPAAPTPAEPAPVKKHRGRPKGSKNKPRAGTTPAPTVRTARKPRKPRKANKATRKAVRKLARQVRPTQAVNRFASANYWENLLQNENPASRKNAGNSPFSNAMNASQQGSNPFDFMNPTSHEEPKKLKIKEVFHEPLAIWGRQVESNAVFTKATAKAARQNTLDISEAVKRQYKKIQIA